jgi:glycosyltransferase involved in cell wall biosynthesis
MNIVFLTLAFPIKKDERNIYTDLMDEFALQGHKVTVLRQDESRLFGEPTETLRNSVSVFSIPTGRITKAPLVQKAFNLLFLEHRFTKVIKKKYFGDTELVIYSTPPINFANSIKLLKRTTNCKSYLLLKDIFPQNAVDLQLFRKGTIAWLYYHLKEKELYKCSDLIGCMSPANLEYFLLHNPKIPANRIHICPNSIKTTHENKTPLLDMQLLQILKIPVNHFRLIYGGNIGKPQGIDFIIKVLQALENEDAIFTTIVGDGTEYRRLEKQIEANSLKKVKLIASLPKQKYLSLLASMDVGLIFLDSRFTIPNFPSRVLDYLDYGLPIIAATDTTCDIRQEICDAGAGLWSKAGDVEACIGNIRKLKDNKTMFQTMKKFSRKILIEKYTVTQSVSIINEELSKHPTII